jgi:uncharacterized protein (DUF302 family)
MFRKRNGGKGKGMPSDMGKPPQLNADDWVDRYGDALFHFAKARVKDRSTAEDLVQDTFVAAIQSKNRYKGKASEKTWLFSMKYLRVFIFLTFFAAICSAAFAADGLVEMRSPYSVKETMSRLERIVQERGLNIFARIDHSAGAASIGKSLRPTELLVFGNPKGGTPLMQCVQTTGIDLPLKVLVWEDPAKQVWLGYNDPAYLADRHSVTDCPVVEKLREAMAGIAEAAVSR